MVYNKIRIKQKKKISIFTFYTSLLPFRDIWQLVSALFIRVIEKLSFT